MYTEQMEKVVRDAAPLDLEKAKAVGAEIGMSYRSVIAKAKQLGVEYVAKPAPVRKAKETTKADMVKELEGIFGRDLDGLEKAPKAVLAGLVVDMTERFTVFDA